MRAPTLTSSVLYILLCVPRCALKRHVDVTDPLSSGDLCVGVLGFGHLGKQVLLSLLEKASIKSLDIKISTRRPEAAGNTEVNVFGKQKSLTAGFNFNLS